MRKYEQLKAEKNPDNDEAKDKQILSEVIKKVEDKFKLIDKDFFDSLDKIIHSHNTVFDLNIEN